MYGPVTQELAEFSIRRGGLHFAAGPVRNLVAGNAAVRDLGVGDLETSQRENSFHRRTAFRMPSMDHVA